MALINSHEFKWHGSGIYLLKETYIVGKYFKDFRCASFGPKMARGLPSLAQGLAAVSVR
jgi:hypothetical protein